MRRHNKTDWNEQRAKWLVGSFLQLGIFLLPAILSYVKLIKLVMIPLRKSKNVSPLSDPPAAKKRLRVWEYQADPSETPRPRIGFQRAQRVCDFVVCLLLLVLLLPLFALIALLVRIDSPGPVLFIQKRVGRNGDEFPFFKFRSMVADAEARRLVLEKQNERSGPVFKMKNDPRITRSGRVLRKYSLDELPQLLNVLRGEMSLIGPRPALPREVAQYTARQRQRLGITPGVTGLWQVSGRASISFEHSVELDLHYIAHQSVWLNTRILLMTIPAVLKGDGAY